MAPFANKVQFEYITGTEVCQKLAPLGGLFYTERCGSTFGGPHSRPRFTIFSDEVLWVSDLQASRHTPGGSTFPAA
jgi:hypothetical protein